MFKQRIINKQTLELIQTKLKPSKCIKIKQKMKKNEKKCKNKMD